MNTEVNLQEMLKVKETELNKIIAQVKQINDEMVRLQEQKDRLTEHGLEVKGSVRTLQELVALQKAQELINQQPQEANGQE